MPEKDPMYCRSEFARKEYVDARLIALETRLTEKFEQIRNEIGVASSNLDKQLNSASTSLDKRVESINQFRSEMGIQASKFITRSEWETGHSRVMEDIRGLRESRAEMEGKASMNSVLLGYIFTTVSIIIACASALAQFIHMGGK